jgi:transcriptional regulator CtsR
VKHSTLNKKLGYSIDERKGGGGGIIRMSTSNKRAKEEQ